MILDGVEPSKVIFLDIDGVLATSTKRSIFAPKTKWIKDYDCYPFDPYCVEILNEIIDNTDGAEIVLSSDWQKHFDLVQLEEIFKLNGLKKAPIDHTKQVRVKMTSPQMVDRVVAINKYLYEHSSIQKFVVIDDLPMYNDFHAEVFAWCYDGVKGIALEGIKDKIILNLNY